MSLHAWVASGDIFGCYRGRDDAQPPQGPGRPGLVAAVLREPPSWSFNHCPRPAVQLRESPGQSRGHVVVSSSCVPSATGLFMWPGGFVGHCPTGWLSHPTACSAAMQGPALASRDTRSHPNLGPRMGAFPNLPSVSPGGGCDSGLEGCWAHTCPPFPDKAEKVFSKAVTPISDTQTRSISAFPEAMTQIAGSRGPSLLPSGFSITSALTCTVLWDRGDLPFVGLYVTASSVQWRSCLFSW